jgi:signal peptidase I
MLSCPASPDQAVRIRLAAETLRSSGKLRARATGSSMVPALRDGDIVHIERRGIDAVRVGQIAALECYGRMVVHRVIRKTPASKPSALLTRGDTVLAHDPPISSLLGVVVAIERNGRAFTPVERLTRIGRIFSIVLGLWHRRASASLEMSA